ncbi:TetR/AcrR family transcriptional regulator [Pedobacter ureilyticus]|jgi:AcrR family transcriptional regulator|uniref:TetR/AcrR family transcriptional regulator n=1 Tax=Pedobacter ureilyticus TaxID=1393051 RepID=A0ABW9J065_9SPHI|nr:TetR/AcrR family transcriptional regulator [Pedobacter helvus]
MERKAPAGNVRNKERSKKKFLDAVGKILKTKGYAALKVNDIAATAGVDKKMIYTYFGGMDGLMDEYIRSQDYWSNVSDDNLPKEITDGGKTIAKEMLISQFDHVFKNKELQKLLLWRLSEERKSLRKLTDNQEMNGEALFSAVADRHFDQNSKKFRAIMAIMISGLYYLDIYSTVNGSVFCGLDMKTDEGRNEVKQAISFLMEQTYDHL